MYSARQEVVTKYKVGIYLRLSREDESNKESESIANQRLFLMSYALERGWDIVDEYIDDGYTGTNFQRPGFKRMLEDAKKKRINCIITKDMSRLGRDYIETGHYIEKFFPENNIRYVAVSDGIDTYEESAGLDITPFKAVINDLYAKDISKKVRDALDAKKKAGEFLGSFAPYGYMKDPDNKYKLIIDEEVAPVVRRIFDMYLEGLGYTKISKILTDEGILNPARYKETISNYKNPHKLNFDRWTPDSIRKMLSNPAYAGNLAQSKQKKISYKVNKKVAIPECKWITVDDTHEPIVPHEVYNAVQELKSRNITHEKKHTILLTGIFYCGDCGTRMTNSNYYTSKKECKNQYVCTKYKRFSACTRHAVKADEIEEYVISEIRSMAKEMLDYEKLMSIADASENHKPMSGKNNNDIRKLEKKLEDVPRNLKQLYIDKLKGIVTEEEFVMLKQSFEADIQLLNIKLSTLLAEKQKTEEQYRDKEGFLKIIREIITFESIDKQTLVKLIKRIEIFEDMRVVIQYNFQNPFIV